MVSLLPKHGLYGPCSDSCLCLWTHLEFSPLHLALTLQWHWPSGFQSCPAVISFRSLTHFSHLCLIYILHQRCFHWFFKSKLSYPVSLLMFPLYFHHTTYFCLFLSLWLIFQMLVSYLTIKWQGLWLFPLYP